jgi:hypothetical protein
VTPGQRQNLLLQPDRQLAVRGPTAQSVNQGAIPSLANALQHAPHLAVGYLQPLGRHYLRQLLLLVQDSQSVPFLLAQSDPLRFHWPPRPPMEPDISTLHKPDILILRRQLNLSACRFNASSDKIHAKQYGVQRSMHVFQFLVRLAQVI